MSTHRIECTVNGEPHSMEVPARRLLSDDGADAPEHEDGGQQLEACGAHRPSTH